MTPTQKSTSSELVSLTPVITIFTSADSSLRKTDSKNLDEFSVNQEVDSIIVVEELAQVETADLSEKNTISSDNQEEITSEVESIVSLPTPTEAYNCEKCSYSSHNKHYLKQHVDLVHTSQRPYKCPFCDYAGKRSYSLKEHLIVHSNDWPYQCAHCNAIFRKKSHLTNHNKMHTGILVFRCILCKEQVYTSERVDLIQSSASSQGFSTSMSKTEPFKIAGKSVCSQNQSGKHLFTCTLCDFQTPDVDMLKVHGDSHYALPTLVTPFSKNGVKDNNLCSDAVMIQCTECGFVAQDKSTMTDHMWTHLNKDEKLSPPLSEQKEVSGKSEFSLSLAHDKKFLSSLTPSALIHKCTECSFLSKEANTLLTHMLQHKKNPLGVIMPSAKQSVLEIGTAATMVEESISSLSLSTTSETSSGNLVSNSSDKASFLQDQITRHFQCTICGYTCELQRTIKAHIWKHSGHRDVDYPMFQNGPLSIYEDINKHDGYLSQPFIPNLKTKDQMMSQVSLLSSENSAIVSQVPKASTSSLSPDCLQHIPAVQTVMATTMTDIGNLHNKSLVSSEDSSVVIKIVNDGKDQKSQISKATEVHSRHTTPKSVPSKNLLPSSCPVKMPDQKSTTPYLVKVALMGEPNGLLSLMEFKENTKMIPKRRNCESTENALYQPIRKKNCIETFSNSKKDLRASEKRKSPQEDFDKIPIYCVSKEGNIILNIKNKEITASTENDNGKNLFLVPTEKQFQESPVIKINKTKMDSIIDSESEKSILDKTTDDQFLPPAQTLEILATNPKNSCAVTTENEHSKLSLEIGSLPKTASENREENNSDSVENDEEHDNESAVALLSLLKHLSTFKSGSESFHTIDKGGVTTTRPIIAATVPKNTTTTTTTTTVSSGISNVITAVTTSDVKPKMGISSSLLAVIEQLREHSKSENEKSNISFSNPTRTKENNSNNDKVTSNKSKTIHTKSAEEGGSLLMESNNIEHIQEPGNYEMHFRCKLCHYTNVSHNQLLQHMRFHRAKKPFECSFCKYVAMSSSDLQTHMMQHCKLRTFQCKWCPVTLNCKSQLRAHMHTHCKKEPYVCKHCKFEAGGLLAYQEHLQQMHTKKAVHFCCRCKEHFLYLQELQKHQKTCNGRKKVSNSDHDYNDDDNNNNNSSSNNKLNIEQSCRITGTIVSCTKCGQSFASSIEKGKHATFLCCKEWLCQKCNFSSNSFATFQNHMRLHCNMSSSLKCKLCDFTAVSSRSLKSHMKRHVNDQHLIQQLLEQYKCNLCGYVCHHLPSLKSHMWRHASDKNYSYAFTNEVINEAIDYDSHLEHFVDSEDSGSGSDTADPSFLKSDTANHSVSPCMVAFRCCQCGFETINKAALNGHMKSHVDVIQRTLDVYQTATCNNQKSLLVEMNSLLSKGTQNDKTTSLHLISD